MKFLKILALVFVALVVVIVGMVAIDLVFGWLLATLAAGLGLPWLQDVDVFWLVLFVALILPKGWIIKRLRGNKPYVCHATMDIEAPVGEVWDMYRLRPRDDYHSITMPIVRAVPGISNQFELVVDGRLSKDDDIPETMKMQVDEEIENFYIRMHCMNAESLPLFGKDLVSTEIWMEEIAPNRTRVTYAENLSRLTMITVLAFLFLNPARDGLKRVKALCEGQEDTSWMTKSFNDIGPNGEVGSQAGQTATMVAVATTLVLGGFMFGLFWFIFSLPV